MENNITFNIKCTMNKRWINNLCSMLDYMQHCGEIGHSSIVGFYSDGDGDFRPKFEIDKDYEKALKHADDDNKSNIDLYDFVDKKYERYIDESKKYRGIINSKSQAPCGYLIYDGDIKREVGLIRCKSDSTNKEVITTVIDGMVAENYKFVKNDLLKVDIWLTINNIFKLYKDG